MAELFQTSVPNVSMHIRNVFSEGEVQALATVKEFITVRQEGSRRVARSVEHYNIQPACPGVSVDLIRKVLKRLRGTQIECVGRGPSR